MEREEASSSIGETGSLGVSSARKRNVSGLVWVKPLSSTKGTTSRVCPRDVGNRFAHPRKNILGMKKWEKKENLLTTFLSSRINQLNDWQDEYRANFTTALAVLKSYFQVRKCRWEFTGWLDVSSVGNNGNWGGIWGLWLSYLPESCNIGKRGKGLEYCRSVRQGPWGAVSHVWLTRRRLD